PQAPNGQYCKNIMADRRAIVAADVRRSGSAIRFSWAMWTETRGDAYEKSEYAARDHAQKHSSYINSRSSPVPVSKRQRVAATVAMGGGSGQKSPAYRWQTSAALPTPVLAPML